MPSAVASFSVQARDDLVAAGVEHQDLAGLGTRPQLSCVSKRIDGLNRALDLRTALRRKAAKAIA